MEKNSHFKGFNFEQLDLNELNVQQLSEIDGGGDLGSVIFGAVSGGLIGGIGGPIGAIGGAISGGIIAWVN